MDRWIYNQIAKREGRFKGLSVLDCGCGPGTNSLMLATLGAKIFAFDKSPEKISKLNSSAKQNGLTVQSQVCSILDFIPTQPYDIVLFTNVLHFIPKEDRPIALGIVLNSIKPEGLLLYCDLADDNLPEEQVRTQLHRKLYAINEGFIYLEDEPHPGAPYPHEHKIHFLIGRKKI